MTTMELQQWRESFIERYLNRIEDRAVIEELECFMKRIFPASPVAFDLREARQEIALAERELKEGKGIDEHEMGQFFDRWRARIG